MLQNPYRGIFGFFGCVFDHLCFGVLMVGPMRHTKACKKTATTFAIFPRLVHVLQCLPHLCAAFESAKCGEYDGSVRAFGSDFQAAKCFQQPRINTDLSGRPRQKPMIVGAKNYQSPHSQRMNRMHHIPPAFVRCEHGQLHISGMGIHNLTKTNEGFWSHQCRTQRAIPVTQHRAAEYVGFSGIPDKRDITSSSNWPQFPESSRCVAN